MNIYRLLSRRNDIKALIRGKLPQRVVRKLVWRHTSNAARLLCKALGVGR
jgi:hypothetical protein